MGVISGQKDKKKKIPMKIAEVLKPGIDPLDI